MTDPILGALIVDLQAALTRAATALAAPTWPITDRVVRAKPAPLPLGPAGFAFLDPTFGTPLRRLTDAHTVAGQSLRTPSSSGQRTWSADSQRAVVVATGGGFYLINPVTPGPAILVSGLYGSLEFDATDPHRVYGTLTASPNHHTLGVADLSGAAPVVTSFFNPESIIPGLAAAGDTYLGQTSCGGTQIAILCGGGSQDQHHYIVHGTTTDLAHAQVLDTLTRTGLGWHVHGAQIDGVGRFVVITPAGGDNVAVKLFVWDTLLDTVTPITIASSGHSDLGFGTMCNQDVLTQYDAFQWCVRSLATPNIGVRELIAPVLTPELVYAADHQSWLHARADRLVPIVSGTYRYATTPPTPVVPWRAWDDEILAIPTDGLGGPIQRYCHHQSVNCGTGSTLFWNDPRPNTSPDGQWAIFTSNWGDGLGLDVDGVTPRQDVFLVALRLG